MRNLCEQRIGPGLCNWPASLRGNGQHLCDYHWQQVQAAAVERAARRDQKRRTKEQGKEVPRERAD